jgi:hypothetical protein
LKAIQPRAAEHPHTRARSCDGRVPNPPATDNIHLDQISLTPCPMKKNSPLGSMAFLALQCSSHLALVEVLYQLRHFSPRPQRHREANLAALCPLLKVP